MMTANQKNKIIAFFCLVMEFVDEKVKSDEDRQLMSYALLSVANRITEDLLDKDKTTKKTKGVKNGN